METHSGFHLVPKYTNLNLIHPAHPMVSVLYCTVLYCTVLYCTVLYCTVLYREPSSLLTQWSPYCWHSRAAVSAVEPCSHPRSRCRSCVTEPPPLERSPASPSGLQESWWSWWRRRRRRRRRRRTAGGRVGGRGTGCGLAGPARVRWPCLQRAGWSGPVVASLGPVGAGYWRLTSGLHVFPACKS